MSSKFSSPFMTKSPLRQKKGEIRDTSEILGDQPGYKPNIGKVIQGGSVNVPSGGMGSAKFAGLVGKIMAGVATGAAVVGGVIRDRYAKKRYKESQEKWKKKNAEIKSPLNQNDTFGGTPDTDAYQKAYEEAADQLYAEKKITESNDEADKLITKRMKENAKKFAKSLKKK
jgi:hypothetical protein